MQTHHGILAVTIGGCVEKLVKLEKTIGFWGFVSKLGLGNFVLHSPCTPSLCYLQQLWHRGRTKKLWWMKAEGDKRERKVFCANPFGKVWNLFLYHGCLICEGFGIGASREMGFGWNQG